MKLKLGRRIVEGVLRRASDRSLTFSLRIPPPSDKEGRGLSLEISEISIKLVKNETRQKISAAHPTDSDPLGDDNVDSDDLLDL